MCIVANLKRKGPRIKITIKIKISTKKYLFFAQQLHGICLLVVGQAHGQDDVLIRDVEELQGTGSLTLHSKQLININHGNISDEVT